MIMLGGDPLYWFPPVPLPQARPREGNRFQLRKTPAPPSNGRRECERRRRQMAKRAAKGGGGDAR